MKKGLLLLFLLALIVPLSALAEKPLGVDEFTSVDQLSSEILSYFPKVQGEVTSVQGNRLTIGLGTKNSLVPGVTLVV